MHSREKEKSMNRRDLLKNGLGLALGLGANLTSSASFAAPFLSQSAQNSQHPRLLLVFLRGGYDASNLLIPTSSSFYYEARPNIAIAKPSSESDSAIALNTDWGLHPALRETIYPLYQQGQVAFIPFAGTDDLSRSHFETQDSIELGQALNTTRNFKSGFMNRLAEQIGGGVASMSFTDQLPMVMQGQANVANFSLRQINRANVDERHNQIIEQMYQNTSMSKQVQDGFKVRGEVIRDMQAEMNEANRNAISTRGFELEAKRIAKMMREKYALGFIDVGGWDTHVNQGAGKGALANKFEELGRGLLAYQQEMGSAWKNTTVVVISEFGRTFRENGKQGTDHGHGTVYWVLGGSVKGGRVLGEQVQVTAGSLFENRDYPILNEYRSVFAGLFSEMYGLKTAQLDAIFSGVKARRLGLL
jgi:uncharacterized protein (DUF1501 family)